MTDNRSMDVGVNKQGDTRAVHRGMRLLKAEGPRPDYLRPLTAPRWVTSSVADHMRPDDPVLGFLLNGDSYVLPWWIMKNHHVANIDIASVPLVIALCEVCTGASAFDPRVGGQRLNFRVGGAYRGTFLLRDDETGSIWAPFTGEALAGPLAGTVLDRFPIHHSTWEEWTMLQPGAVVADGAGESRDGHGSTRSPGSLESPNGLMESLIHRDDRLAHNELVLGVKTDGEARAYPLSQIHRHGPVLADRLGVEDIVVIGRPSGWIATAFSRSLDGELLDFAGDGDESIVEHTTGSRFDAFGRAIDGPLTGRTLTYVHSGVEEWNTWVAAHPDTGIFEAETPDDSQAPRRASE